MMVLQKDVFGFTSLEYFERYDVFKLLETKVIDCIVIDLWESNLDVNGGFLENSTAYQIVDFYLSGVMVDYERENRYYAPKKV
jgi:hypothetical protein